MGQVWVARDASLGRKIALKELRPDQSDNSIICSRFLYEARVTAQLEHPGIVPVYEMGGGRVPFYTMRFVKGRTLCEAIRSYHKERRQGKAQVRSGWSSCWAHSWAFATPWPTPIRGDSSTATSRDRT